jgi:hypothetical protein
MENWIPGLSTIVSRYGTKLWNLLSGVKTIHPYNSSVNKLFGFTNSGVFDVSVEGVVTDQSVAITSGKVRAINFSAANTQYLICCNGVDKVLIYNGATWKFLDSLSTPALTFPGGSTFTSADITVIKEHQTRLWMLPKTGLSAYYLDIAAIGGTLTEFPMGSIFRRGGHFVDMETWTVDGGSGTGDYFAFLTSEGEVAIYSGYDPTQATTWGWVGVFFVGVPIGDRPLQRYGGDMVVLTLNGIGVLSKLMASAEISNAAMLSDTINKSFANVTSLYQNNYGWQIHESPKDNLFLVNIPTVDGANSEQYVMYNLTNTWTKFTGLDCTCMAQFKGELIFATPSGSISRYTSDAQYTDLSNPFRLFIQFAYSFLGTKGNKKKPVVLKPLLRITNVKAQIYEMSGLTWGIDKDFANRPEISEVSEVPFIYADIIGTGIIGGLQIGAHELVLQSNHAIACMPGFAFSPQLEMYSQGSRWEFMGLQALVVYGNFL